MKPHSIDLERGQLSKYGLPSNDFLMSAEIVTAMYDTLKRIQKPEEVSVEEIKTQGLITKSFDQGKYQDYLTSTEAMLEGMFGQPTYNINTDGIDSLRYTPNPGVLTHDSSRTAIDADLNFMERQKREAEMRAHLSEWFVKTPHKPLFDFKS